MGGLLSCTGEDRMGNLKRGTYREQKRQGGAELDQSREGVQGRRTTASVPDQANYSIEEDVQDDQLREVAATLERPVLNNQDGFDGFKTKTVDEVLTENRARLLEERAKEARQAGKANVNESDLVTEEEILHGHTKGKGEGILNDSNLNATVLDGNRLNTALPEYAEEESDFLAKRRESDVMSDLTEEEEEVVEEPQEEEVVVKEIVYDENEEEKKEESDDSDEEIEKSKQEEVIKPEILIEEDPLEALRKKERYFRDATWNLRVEEKEGVAPRLSYGSPSRVRVYDMTDYHPDRDRAITVSSARGASQEDKKRGGGGGGSRRAGLLDELLSEAKPRYSFTPLWPEPQEWMTNSPSARKSVF